MRISKIIRFICGILCAFVLCAGFFACSPQAEPPVEPPDNGIVTEPEEPNPDEPDPEPDPFRIISNGIMYYPEKYEVYMELLEECFISSEPGLAKADVFKLIRSPQEFQAALAELPECSFISLNHFSYPDGKKYVEPYKKYDEAYFEDKALIFYYVFEPSLNNQIWIEDINIEQERLIMYTTQYYGSAGQMARGNEFLIEIKKSDIEGVVTLQINQTNVQTHFAF